MARRLCVLVALLTLVVGAASAQIKQEDARAVLQNSLKAMGGTNLKTIQYAGSGTSTMIGQTYGLTEERVRQIESKTLAKLRRPESAQLLRDYLDEA